MNTTAGRKQIRYGQGQVRTITCSDLTSGRKMLSGERDERESSERSSGLFSMLWTNKHEPIRFTQTMKIGQSFFTGLDPPQGRPVGGSGVYCFGGMGGILNPHLEFLKWPLFM